jgi:hypothetical protein
VRQRSWDEGLGRRSYDKGLGEGLARELIRVFKVRVGEESPPLSSRSWHYIGKQKFASNPSVGVGFTCHSSDASWASSRGLGPYEYGISQ